MMEKSLPDGSRGGITKKVCFQCSGAIPVSVCKCKFIKEIPNQQI